MVPLVCLPVLLSYFTGRVLQPLDAVALMQCMEPPMLDVQPCILVQHPEPLQCLSVLIISPYSVPRMVASPLGVVALSKFIACCIVLEVGYGQHLKTPSNIRQMLTTSVVQGGWPTSFDATALYILGINTSSAPGCPDRLGLAWGVWRAGCPEAAVLAAGPATHHHPLQTNCWALLLPRAGLLQRLDAGRPATVGSATRQLSVRMQS